MNHLTKKLKACQLQIFKKVKITERKTNGVITWRKTNMNALLSSKGTPSTIADIKSIAGFRRVQMLRNLLMLPNICTRLYKSFRHFIQVNSLTNWTHNNIWRFSKMVKEHPFLKSNYKCHFCRKRNSARFNTYEI
jgi:hypothetical protein